MKRQWGFLVALALGATTFVFFGYTEGMNEQFNRKISAAAPSLETSLPSMHVSWLPDGGKWTLYSDLEQLQNAHPASIYVPSQLPKGFKLDRREVRNETIRAVYTSGKKELLFLQTPQAGSIPKPAEIQRQSNGNELVFLWSANAYSFELIGHHVTEKELNAFKQSLIMLSPPDTNTRHMPFEVLQLSGYLQHFEPEGRVFSIFTYEQFHAFAKKHELTGMKEQQNGSAGWIMGLFSGEKGSSGYTIAVSEVTLQDNELRVVFHETEPAPDASTLSVISYPYQFINVELPEGRRVDTVQFVTSRGEAIAKLPTGGQ